MLDIETTPENTMYTILIIILLILVSIFITSFFFKEKEELIEESEIDKTRERASFIMNNLQKNGFTKYEIFQMIRKSNPDFMDDFIWMIIDEIIDKGEFQSFNVHGKTIYHPPVEKGA